MTPTLATSASSSSSSPASSSSTPAPNRPSKPKTVVSARITEQLYMKLRDYTIKAGHLNMSETVASILGEHFAPKRLKNSAMKGKKS